jgi:hypothetical protein
MYEALEGTLLAAIAAGGVYALTQQQPEPLLTPASTRFDWRWPDRFRPGHRRQVEDAAEIEADDFLGELHDAGAGEGAALPEQPLPDPGPARHRHPSGPGRHRRPGPLTLNRAGLPSSSATVPVTPAPGKPPWAAVQLAAEPVLTADQLPPVPPAPEGPEPLRVYEGPDQQDPPTGVLRVRDVLDAGLGDYLGHLPEYPRD